MNVLRKLRAFHILMFLLLLLSLFFAVFTELTQGKAGLFLFDYSGMENSESSIIMRFQTEGMVISGQSVLQGRTGGNRLWRYILSFVIFAFFIKAFSKIMFLEYFLPGNSGWKFFHNLVISFFLGGRAPPSPAY